MRQLSLFPMAVALLLLLVSFTAASNPQSSISYNGRLTDNLGNPVPAGMYTIHFTIFADSLGGTPALWTDSYNVSVDSDGLFAVMLGPIDASVFYDPNMSVGSVSRFLEIQLDGDPPLAPRTRIGATPYSALAERVSGDMFTAPGSLRVVDTTGDTLYQAQVYSSAANTQVNLMSLYNNGADYDTVSAASLYSNGSQSGLGLNLGGAASVALQAQSAQSYMAFIIPPTMESVAFTKMLLADSGLTFYNPGSSSKSPEVASGLYSATFGLGGMSLVDTTGDTLYQTSSSGSTNTRDLNVEDSATVGPSAKSAEAAVTRLRVNGIIHSTDGGFKFPDGSIQATASGTGLWQLADSETVALANSSQDVTVGTSTVYGKFNVYDTLSNIGGFFQSKQRALWAEVGQDNSATTNSAVIGLCYGTGGQRRGAFLYGEGDSATYGVIAQGTGDAPSAEVYGIYAGAFGMGTLKAGYFDGDVDVIGTLSKSAGSFKIDHPLDPENKYLYHSFVESPDMMNVYNGNVVTDASGQATVRMPDYFEALNKDFRYQLTVIGEFAQAIVAQEIENGRFTIKTDKPNVKVSWQVTGIRNDAYARDHRIPVEVAKSPENRGTYLHPADFGAPSDKSESARRQIAPEKSVSAAEAPR